MPLQSIVYWVTDLSLLLYTLPEFLRLKTVSAGAMSLFASYRETEVGIKLSVRQGQRQDVDNYPLSKN